MLGRQTSNALPVCMREAGLPEDGVHIGILVGKALQDQRPGLQAREALLLDFRPDLVQRVAARPDVREAEVRIGVCHLSARAVIHIVAIVQIWHCAIDWLIVVICFVQLLRPMLYCPQVSQVLPPVGSSQTSELCVRYASRAARTL